MDRYSFLSVHTDKAKTTRLVIIYFMGSETLPSAGYILSDESSIPFCYILSDESSIPFYSTSKGKLVYACSYNN